MRPVKRQKGRARVGRGNLVGVLLAAALGGFTPAWGDDAPAAEGTLSVALVRLDGGAYDARTERLFTLVRDEVGRLPGCALQDEATTRTHISAAGSMELFQTDPVGLARFGIIAGVDRVVTAEIRVEGKSRLMKLQLIDVAAEALAESATAEVPDAADPVPFVRDAVEQLFSVEERPPVKAPVEMPTEVINEVQVPPTEPPPPAGVPALLLSGAGVAGVGVALLVGAGVTALIANGYEGPVDDGATDVKERLERADSFRVASWVLLGTGGVVALGGGVLAGVGLLSE